MPASPFPATPISIACDMYTPVKTALINYATATTPGIVIPAVAGRKLRVLLCDFVTEAEVTVQFQDDDSVPNVIVPAQLFAAKSGKSTTFCPIGHFETGVGLGLDIVLGGAVQVSGYLRYIEVE